MGYVLVVVVFENIQFVSLTSLEHPGTHYTTSVTYGGQVEVTTMIRKSETEAKELDESNVEVRILYSKFTTHISSLNTRYSIQASLEANEKESEDANDSESASEVVVETSEEVPSTVEEGGENSLPPQGSTTIHTTEKSSNDQSTSSGDAAGGVADVLVDTLRSAALAAGTSGISELIKELELKLKVQHSSSKRKKTLLTKENTKNEIRFLGGDTSVDPDKLGGSAFSEWKDTISKNPAAISTIIEPITNLVR